MVLQRLLRTFGMIFAGSVYLCAVQHILCKEYSTHKLYYDSTYVRYPCACVAGRRAINDQQLHEPYSFSFWAHKIQNLVWRMRRTYCEAGKHGDTCVTPSVAVNSSNIGEIKLNATTQHIHTILIRRSNEKGGIKFMHSTIYPLLFSCWWTMKFDSIIHSSYIIKIDWKNVRTLRDFPFPAVCSAVYSATWRTGCVMWIARD